MKGENVIVLFFVAFVALVGAAFLYMRSENTAEDQNKQTIAAYVAEQKESAKKIVALETANTEMKKAVDDLAAAWKTAHESSTKKVEDAIAEVGKIKEFNRKLTIEILPVQMVVNKKVTTRQQTQPTVTPLLKRAGIPKKEGQPNADSKPQN